MILGLKIENYQSEQYTNIPLKSMISGVQPMTGIVLWEELNNKDTDAIQLEYSYMRYQDVVKEKGQYNWTIVEEKMNSAANRAHQIILRFFDAYPGRKTPVPDYIKELPDYEEIITKSEGRDTGFPDWSHPEYQKFVLEFYKKFAEKYDNDPRLAFLEVGFGLWSEYHIYDPGEQLGVNFPSKNYQAKFFNHLAEQFIKTPWMISQDAHVDARTPFATQPELLDLKFGIFDDSFHLAWKPSYNFNGWKFFGIERYKESPMGGEILFPNQDRNDYVDSNWAEQARKFGITFMICEQWLRWISLDRLKEHSLACGYKFKITEFKSNQNMSKITVENKGVAPIYYDAFIAVNGVRSIESLKYLQPGEKRQFMVNSGDKAPELTIECDRLVPGQKIEFEADLE
jgi:hypothetical protein